MRIAESIDECTLTAMWLLVCTRMRHVGNFYISIRNVVCCVVIIGFMRQWQWISQCDTTKPSRQDHCRVHFLPPFHMLNLPDIVKPCLDFDPVHTRQDRNTSVPHYRVSISGFRQKKKKGTTANPLEAQKVDRNIFRRTSSSWVSARCCPRKTWMCSKTEPNLGSSFTPGIPTTQGRRVNSFSWAD